MAAGLSHRLTNIMRTETRDSFFTLNIRVYYEDTDAGGVVFYANYLKFFERARTEWLRHLGINQTELAKRECKLFVVKSLEIQYRKPARLDDLLTVYSTAARVGRASINFEQCIKHGEELLCLGTIEVCCVASTTLRPAALPQELRIQLEKVQK